MAIQKMMTDGGAPVPQPIIKPKTTTTKPTATLVAKEPAPLVQALIEQDRLAAQPVAPAPLAAPVGSRADLVEQQVATDADILPEKLPYVAPEYSQVPVGGKRLEVESQVATEKDIIGEPVQPKPVPVTPSTGTSMPRVSVPSAPKVTTPTTPTAPTQPTTGGQATQQAAVVKASENMPKPEDNAYWNQLVNKKFEYDPATDKDYWKAAANAENAIIQSMISRGGLYSSVARDAVAVKLMDLQLEYEEIAYEKYVDERDFLFQLAGFEQDRLDNAWARSFQVEQYQYQQQLDAWNQNMQMLEYQANREDEMFNRKMQQAANARANASLSLQKRQIEAQEKAASAAQEMNQRRGELAKDQREFELMMQRWESGDGYADKEVAAYFAEYGVREGSWIEKPSVAKMVTQIEKDFVMKGIEIANLESEAGYAADAADYLKGYMLGDDYYEQAGSSEANATATMKQIYYNYKASAITKDGKPADADHIASKLQNMSVNSNALVSSMGSYYYDKLYNELVSAMTKLASE